jgi:ketosteroid isomerase-like protein
MPTSRRAVLAAAGAGLAALELADAAPALASGSDQVVADLIRLSEESNAALMRGDIDAYMSMISLTDDFALMAPVGGPPTHAAQVTSETMQAMGRFFRNGTHQQEVVQTWGSADMVVLAVIERSHVEVGGLPAQDWFLRVTLVYRREGDAWKLAHRHADPLVGGVSLTQAAALAKTGPA